MTGKNNLHVALTQASSWMLQSIAVLFVELFF